MGIRKNQQNLTATERSNFVNALLTLKQNGRYDLFVRLHIDRANGDSDWGLRIGHRSPSFLPWHRRYLIEFEQALQEVNPSVTIPYWDWTTAGSTSTLWANDFLGPNGTSATNWRVNAGPFAQSTGQWTLTVRSDSANYLRRNFGSGGLQLPSASDVNSVLGLTTYDTSPWNSTSINSFRNYLEGFRGPNLHNRVHNWVNGTMAGFGSPNDPVFWLHHCNVDRLWSQWQAQHPGSTYLPTAGTANVVDLNEAMNPWTTTPNDMLNHSAVYTYQ
ncbi:tyrosinase family protein [Actinosynnema sp. NPDC047251]|uniref:Tyrosinase n=1 Tax=Saccharothrix espanaensis (strain ATCC 51144 / DSM 44229 / JCM 9112 / NBRC 15066 / NRRL 15764) TaxID=1179773 RepID=K0K5F6_SACES|nr:tyrosinase family protein [Saccharothrix espanaensis]CCH31783.1 Tyrosinase [Saccharothrix espanaensis DSM 44229]